MAKVYTVEHIHNPNEGQIQAYVQSGKRMFPMVGIDDYVAL